MDFHNLSRRELQALCKRNKIPANITNVAMADALKALEIVEGLGEFSQASEYETGQSFIDSLEGSELTSPYVPSTAARSTRRRNATKEELEAVTSMRRTTRKTATKVSAESQVDTMETPAMMVPTSRRKGQMTSVCQKMDSQLKECVEEEEKKDALMTPAPLGATSRRVAEGTVHRYSTRRSVRLAEKTLQFNDEKSEESELFNNELLAKDSENQEVNLKEGIHMSGIIGIDAIADMEENSENKEKPEVVSAEEQDKTISELEVESTPEEDQMGLELSDNIEYADGKDSVKAVNVCDEVKQSEGFVHVCKSETETTVENSNEMDIEIDSGSRDVHDYKEEDVQDLKEEDTKMAYDIAEADSYFADEIESAKNSQSKQKISGAENVPSTEHIPTLDPQIVQPKEDIIKKAKGTSECLNDLSLRKLTKMFKEKLEITKNPGDEAAVPRPVLQALPENPVIE